MQIRKKLAIIISTLIVIILMVLIGPMDVFTHGFYDNELNYEEIVDDLQEPIDLKNGDYEMIFEPVFDHFIGFGIILSNQPVENTGNLVLTITDKEQKIIDEVTVDLREVTDCLWYKVRLHEFLEKGQNYILKISAQGCDTVPYLQTIDSNYQAEETVSGNLLIAYAYAYPTFTTHNKILIFLFLIAIWGYVLMLCTNCRKLKITCKYASSIILITALLAWNYMYNSMDNQNTSFTDFQATSEGLVSAVINAESDGVWFQDGSNWGLGSYDNGILTPYKSQYGLQGKIFRHLARYIGYESLQLLCCLATAFVFAIIVLLIYFKYNNILAGVFLYTFWLSPWIVNFARNLYWVEFTWFLPMVVGLFCTLRITERKSRIISYLAVFVTILVKCLCGYEYISVIMMGMISFLLVDWIKSIVAHDKEKILLLFKTLFFIGIAAILGFMIAICIHANMRGNGDFIEGVRSIYEMDVLRRTNGSNLNDFTQVYYICDSLNASVWETCNKYYHFGTEVVTGIPGNLFPLLCIIPLGIFGYEFIKKKLNIELFTMYVVFFLTSISWFCLAKGHSYIHTHMNYVLWYFGFVQICIYTIVHKVVCFFREKIK